MGIRDDEDHADLNHFEISFDVTSAKYEGAGVLLTNEHTPLSPFLSAQAPLRTAAKRQSETNKVRCHLL